MANRRASKGTVTWDGGSLTQTEFATQHSVALTGLDPAANYTVTVTAVDQAGNGPTSASTTFTTATAQDTAPPLILSGPTVSAITQNSALLQWETNEPATTVVLGDLARSVPGYRTVHNVELTGLTIQTAYSLTVSSTDQAGNGPTSRSIGFSTLALPDTTPPVITKGPWFADVSATGATVLWETDEPANSGVSYNDGTAYGVLNDTAFKREHAVRMTGLNPNTEFQVTVSSSDMHGNGPTLSEPLTLRTLAAADNDPPVFTEAPAVCNLNHQLIQICFRTDEPASVRIDYSRADGTAQGVEARAQLIRNHVLPITGLTANSTYRLRFQVRDAAGNTAQSEPFEVTTLAVGQGAAPRFVQTPSISYQGKDRVVISWETDSPTDARIDYGAGHYGQLVSDGQRKTRHRLVVPNLNAGTAYQFRITATDIDGRSVQYGF